MYPSRLEVGVPWSTKPSAVLILLRNEAVQSAEQTPLTALRFGELALQAGVPPGALNILSGAFFPADFADRCRGCMIPAPWCTEYIRG